jgi:predicted Ser/Thr protein kinase
MSHAPDRDRWLRVRAIVELALETPAADRDRVIADACAGDLELVAEVRRLVAAHQRGDALESPLDAATSLVDNASHRAGDHVGNYTIDTELARGGMGVVYRAWDTRLERWVALKALSPLLPAGAEARERLRREARAAGRVSHDAVATIHALEEIDSELFIVSEYVAGETLRAKLSAGPLAVPQAVSIALAVARGLAAAHELGVVHRDLKPENVMIASDGRVKVVDFGIASIDGPGRGITRTGVVLGTPGYMAPEQVSGQGADARSDVFALGVLLYEMLSGRPPFGDSASWTVVTAVLERDPPPIESIRPDIPSTLALVVATSLAKSPAARYPTAGAVVPALESVRDEIGPASGSRRAFVPAPRVDRPGAVWWLQFHQLAATISLVLMMVPAWKLMSRLPRPTGRILVMTLLAMAAAIGTARLHLWFTARHHGSDLAREIDRIGPLLRWGNRAFALALGVGGLSVADGSPELAAVCLALSAGTLAVGDVIEPATLERARREAQPRS